MKILGLLGGMSWESTIEYYRSANEETRAWGGLHSAPLLLWSADFVEIEEFQAAGSWEEAGSRLAAAAQALEGAGAELLVLRTNTTHKVAGVIEASVSIPLVHIVDSVAAGVLAAGMQRVGLLGTRFTMEEPFWAERMATTGSSACARTARPGQRPHGHHDELCLGCSPKDPGRPKSRSSNGSLAPARRASSSAARRSSFSFAPRTPRSSLSFYATSREKCGPGGVGGLTERFPVSQRR